MSAQHTIALSSDLMSLRDIGPWLANVSLALDMALGATALPRVELAVHELCVNISMHAYGGSRDHTITLTAQRLGDRLIIATNDAGEAYDPGRYSAPQASQPTVGGYGLLIVGRIAKRVEYSRSEGINTWQLEFDENAPSENGGCLEAPKARSLPFPEIGRNDP